MSCALGLCSGMPTQDVPDSLESEKAEDQHPQSSQVQLIPSSRVIIVRMQSRGHATITPALWHAVSQV